MLPPRELLAGALGADRGTVNTRPAQEVEAGVVPRVEHFALEADDVHARLSQLYDSPRAWHR